MDDTHEPTVDDLRVKLCYICREEERHDDDGPPHPPTAWTHPCKCTLVAHESCLLHWIKTQQRDFGRSRGDLKCPQCGELYEFDGFNPRVLRILNTVNRTLSRTGRIVTACCVGTIIVSTGAGLYLTCTAYGAFAVREFVGPGIFRALLTSDPANWPLHAWFYLPMIPFSLIVSRTPIVIWTTSPLVPLLFPWPSTVPISARGSSWSVRFSPLASRPALWPPPPALVCALFPIVRMLYGRLRDRVIKTVVQDLFQPRAQAARQQRQQERRVQQGGDQQPRGNQQEVPQRGLRMELHQGQIELVPPGAAAGRRFQVQVGDHFGFEIAQYIFNRDAPVPANAPGRARAIAVGNNAADGDDGNAVDNPANQQQQGQQPAEGQGPLAPAPAPADQDPQQQQQPPAEPGQGQGQGQEPAAPPRDENDPGAIALRAIRVTGASLGRLIGGALLMPSIARMMGSMLLHISHVVPLLRTIIAPLPPPLPLLPSPPSGPISTLIRLIRGAPAAGVGAVQVGYQGYGRRWLGGSGLGAAVLRGLFATSQEWARNDPVWWRNVLGLGIFIVVKDGLKIYHLWLAKRELEERHIKNKSFAGIDLTGLDLIERERPEA